MSLTLAAQIIFFVSAALVFYVYFGYPILVFAIARLRPRPVTRSGIEPTVSIIIAAYNEERDIRLKIENTFELEYPREKLEIIVVSDGSTDSTDSIVREFADRGVKLVRQDPRGGKTAAQNLAVEHSSGEIILFSDATSIYRPDVINEIVANFADESVGCVAGKLIYVDPAESTVGSAARSYWSYETLLKQSESAACSLIGVSGCLYAVRRANYHPMYPEACSDFLIATLVYKQGLRTIYEPGAVCTEETNRQSNKEMRMRVRVISQTFTDLWRNREMLNPFKIGFYAIQLISHKVLRYGVPVFLAASVISAAMLAPGAIIFLLVFLSQMIFLAAAIAAWVLERMGMKIGPLAIPLYFLLTNIASLAGFLQFLRGERYAAWEPIRDTDTAKV